MKRRATSDYRRARRPARPARGPDRITARLAATLRVEFGEEARQQQYTAVRTNVSGLGETTVPVFWEVAKEGYSFANLTRRSMAAMLPCEPARGGAARAPY